ncbi:MAG: hypothetical protein IT562_21750 [Alphaproteobacteria bacterium]|nr:hypothetical protein [Alphaproteobacteria bacterium]
MSKKTHITFDKNGIDPWINQVTSVASSLGRSSKPAMSWASNGLKKSSS